MGIFNRDCKLAAVVSLLAVLLSGCATNGRAIDVPSVVDSACEWVLPIYISSRDVLTPGTARQILNHNETLEKNCP